MNVQTAITDIHQGKLAPVYLVVGTDRFLAERFKQALLAQVIQSPDDELNYASFDMDETPLSVAVEEAATIPFFGDYRLVFIEHPYFLTTEKVSGGPDHEMAELLQYLQAPSPTTILVLHAAVEKLDERKKVTKALKKQAVLIEAAPLGEKDLRRYLQQTIANEGYQIRPDAFERFIQLTDLDLARGMSELNKLFLYASENKQITLSAVTDLVPKSLEHNLFDMTEYVLKGDADQALRLYHDLLLQGEETIKLIAILLGQVRLLLQTKILMQIGYQQANIVETLGIHPYRVKLAMQQVQKFSLAGLARLFDQLVEEDSRIKTGKMEKELLFELFLLRQGRA
ncbi:DNA polymerase III, delta subunit [Enterococcus canis]|uniref:DNA polymerase III subunit delta n=1 Tax=Enterococcus canis TaxID=214095 RepID=A0A1L8RIT8_9ENTE|nr:DNA polymerase III subunit delta [Enterococcus canis]OJG19622.1 DNA polymerase III, delta subunit [Enterococcus canis]